MAKRTISPTLADIRQDIAGEIPIELILKWATGNKTSKHHNKLLDPYRRFGTVVCSDSSGLSKLTVQKTLFEVLHLVSQPKEIIHAFGVSIGGKAIGVWAADNTEMFYEKSINPSVVLQQMASSQIEMQHLPIKVGMSIHSGEFWDIGGGLYGKDADLVEELAESHAGPGDVLVTKQFARIVGNVETKRLKQPTGDHLTNAVFLYDYTGLSTNKFRNDTAYPIPYDDTFFKFISTYPTKNKDEIAHVTKRYVRHDIVVLIKVIHPPRRFLLEQLTDWVLANAVLKKIDINRLGIETIKSNGNLGIFMATDINEAIEFANETRASMRAVGYTLSIGIATGESLVFPMQDNDREIAGGPVNIASKLAEDSDTMGKIYIHDSIKVKKSKHLEPFRVTISGVEMKGYVLK